MSAEVLTGGCMCGDIRYEATGPVTSSCHCHCRDCQQHSGAAFVTWASFSLKNFKVTKGTLTEYASSPGVTRAHCARCGTTIVYRSEKWPDEIDIAAVSLDDPSAASPTEHLFMDDAPPWTKVGDGLPVHARWR